MSDSTTAETPVIESPPPAPQPAQVEIDDPRASLHKLAQQLMRTRNRKLLIEFLTLRRSIR